MNRWGTLGWLAAAACMAAGCGFLSHEPPPDTDAPDTRPPQVDAAAPPMRDAGSPRVLDAGTPTREAGLDANVDDAAVIDAAFPDAGSPSGCVIEAVDDGVVGLRAIEERSDDDRAMRSDLYWSTGDHVAWAEALEWDDAGRATHIEWTDSRFIPDRVFRREWRRYHDDGRLDEVTIELEGTPTELRRFVYEDGWLTEVVSVVEGVTRSMADFDVDLSARTLRVISWPASVLLEWDEDGRPRWFQVDDTEGPGIARCEETDVVRDGDGVIREQRRRFCGEPAGGVTTQFVYETSASQARLETHDLRAGGFSLQTRRSLAEDLVEFRTQRRPVEGATIEFEETSFGRYRGCGWVPNPRRPTLYLSRVEPEWYGWAAPLEDMADATNFEFRAYTPRD
ncbi:MAG: hypothetical protein AB8I08_05580 [Sandaracinaceae bacterium]